MSCNCKARNNFNKIAKSYDKTYSDRQENLKYGSALNKIANGFLKILSGIIFFIIFIAVSIPILIYSSICIILGKKIKIKLFKNIGRTINEQHII